MSISEQIRQKLIATFRAEQDEHVQKINQGLLALEKNPPEAQQHELLKEIFREAHSLKGSARAVGMTMAETIGHSLEEILLQARDGKRKLTPHVFDLLYQALDAVVEVIDRAESGDSATSSKILILLAALEEATKDSPPDFDHVDHGIDEVNAESAEVSPKSATKSETTPADDSGTQLDASDEVDEDEDEAYEAYEAYASDGTAPTSPINLSSSSNETIRVSVSKLDALMAQFSELLGTKIRIEQRLTEIKELQQFASQWHKEWLPLRHAHNRLTRDETSQNNKDIATVTNFVSQSQEHIRTLNSQSNLLYRQLSNDAMRLSLVIDELQEEIKRVRMLPLDTITTTFERMVRDLARKQKKLIRFEIVGGQTELDKRVLEEIKDPLMHLLRNAVDHGIDSPKERQLSSKPIEGKIILKASQQGTNIIITVSDDGKGLDLEAIRRSAVSKRLLTQADSEKLSPKETARLIFNSGLTTSQIITDISGRGVGMDVVRQNVADLQGMIDVNFQPNYGTTFKIILPLTLASSRGLLVVVNKEMYALPFSTIERMLEVTQSDIGQVEGQPVITYEGQAVGLAWLEDILQLPPRPRQLDRLLVVIVAVADKRMGLVVDELASEQEIVMKTLGKQLVKVSGVAGATVLGSGEVVLVLHTADLIKLAAQTARHHASVEQQNSTNNHQIRKTILVVDDSITTRTLEKNILEAAGYKVLLATNGEEALSTLMADGLPNLIVSDVNMPYLDGLGLTKQVKDNPHYQDIPVILVTSLDSPTDKARGIEVGADAYIVKSNFDQGNLLDTIEQLV
ncbi:hybrid sensor histidine kinase/response regulator [Anaerolineales bacterium HSG24]|nr:hybrid sensor histidine kinase/response regulator [Anaerolineales bacterium HSG24]